MIFRKCYYNSFCCNRRIAAVHVALCNPVVYQVMIFRFMQTIHVIMVLALCTTIFTVFFLGKRKIYKKRTQHEEEPPLLLGLQNTQTYKIIPTKITLSSSSLTSHMNWQVIYLLRPIVLTTRQRMVPMITLETRGLEKHLLRIIITKRLAMSCQTCLIMT